MFVRYIHISGYFISHDDEVNPSICQSSTTRPAHRFLFLSLMLLLSHSLSLHSKYG